MNQLPTDWHQRAAALAPELRPLVAGRHHEASSGRLVQRADPAGEGALPVYEAAGDEAVAAALRTARDAFDAGPWGRTGPMERRGMLLAFAAGIEAQAEELALRDSVDVGKPISAAVGEAHVAAGFVRYYAEAIDKHYGATAPTGPGALELQLRRPRGVVAAITPWNFPVINAALKIGPALAAGNTVVLKPSELSPASVLLLGQLGLEAGLPPGVLNVLPGDGLTGELLARSAAVDMLTFTGSTATGRALLRATGESTIKPLLLECGGKSPELLFADMDGPELEMVVAQIAGGALWNQGQVCVARTRLLVEASIFDRVLGYLLAQTGAVRVGHPRDPATGFGPLASPAQAARVRGFIEAGIGEGAELLLDGRVPAGGGGSCYVGPTVFAGADADSSLAQEEIFGPVITVFPFRSEQEAVALANHSRYGLAASVWTRDLARGHRVSSQLRAGKVRVCCAPVPPVPAAGFAHSAEPAGQSGYGIEGGMRGLESYTRQQAVEFAWPALS